MIYMAPYIMPLIRENPLRREVGGGWALEINTFLGTVKWQQAVRRVTFRAQKSQNLQGPTPLPLAQVMNLLA
jgi:hypothetical protein